MYQFYVLVVIFSSLTRCTTNEIKEAFKRIVWSPFMFRPVISWTGMFLSWCRCRSVTPKNKVFFTREGAEADTALGLGLFFYPSVGEGLAHACVRTWRQEDRLGRGLSPTMWVSRHQAWQRAREPTEPASQP